MPFLFKRLVLFLSITAAFAADKEHPVFRPDPAVRYPHRQTNEKVTIAADPYVSGEKVQTAFGKLNPYEYGILPVLVVVQNDGNQSIRLDRIQAVYTGPQGAKVEATPASEVRYLRGPDRPKVVTGPPGIGKIGRDKKNPLAAWEIEGRAFAAKMLPAGQTASGFFYFQTGLQRGATLYLSGLADASSGQELFYYEIPLDQ
ncbi:MAG TPA: hypothetical protein VKT49_04240 [Bryobacteraceae bacterium]|nr:hypothetical protein [Bryobacteraceae bacterium]